MMGKIDPIKTPVNLILIREKFLKITYAEMQNATIEGTIKIYAKLRKNGAEIKPSMVMTVTITIILIELTGFRVFDSISCLGVICINNRITIDHNLLQVL